MTDGGRPADERPAGAGLAIGLDCGSTHCKGALIDAQGRLLAVARRPTGWNVPAAARELLARLHPPTGPVVVAATGYGRFQVEDASLTLTEIRGHALGAELLRPGAATVVDVGGQDTKVVSTAAGKPKNFLMNDKCAAGTGRFLEMALGRLELTLEELEARPEPAEPARLNSVCAVFAESELMGLLAAGQPREDVAAGVLIALADKAAALAARLPPADPVVMTGGLSASRLLARHLSRALGRPVEALAQGFYAGALGAAWAALSEAS
ncbi:MAG: acyl-CoA dehydratase activase [Deltaproteobacteria bacterium]|nr:acyl-CoA dehydratase activase [Deltaproteobacteria bacterium]